MTRLRFAALFAALSLVFGGTAVGSATAETLTPVDNSVVKKMGPTADPVYQTDALGQYVRTCYWPGYSYRSTLSLKWTSYNGIKYLTRLDLTTNYPKGSYADVTWGGKTGRVSTGSGTTGVAHFNGWVASNGTTYRNKHGFSVPLSADPVCYTSGTV